VTCPRIRRGQAADDEVELTKFERGQKRFFASLDPLDGGVGLGRELLDEGDLYPVWSRRTEECPRRARGDTRPQHSAPHPIERPFGIAWKVTRTGRDEERHGPRNRKSDARATRFRSTPFA
jgi:hypothetical protein